ncbi:MAG: 1-deoxy-D-xylulose-5-phosphate synthase [Oscillospiraceae bacterium]|nr:1-deoxy-D-xylulose-5-phosphate synthase [Oscillospiraceae bacterium]
MNSESNKPINNIALKDLNLPYDLKKLTSDQCRDLCKEIRSILIKTVSCNGGHLASNLGVVELTMALHRVFSSPDDKLVWDVGHQTYTHKILTGRLDRFSTLRQENGISGFPKPEESIHDSFISGHSSTSVSVACGIAEAMKLQQKTDNYAVAIIGDGAFTGGLAYEGLNNAGKSNSNLIVILNHNDMSISKNVGAFAKYLSSIRNKEKYVNTKNAVEQVLKKTPVVGAPISKALVASKTALKGVVLKGNTMFEDFGFVYLGPVNGHDIEELEKVLSLAKTFKKPVFVHVNTVKGKGYLPAERNPGEYHGIARFDIMTGNPEVVSSDSYSSVFGRELVRIARTNNKICAITAAMKYGTGLQYFAEEFKNRFYDVGIAEQHAVTYSSALSMMGMIPVFAVYSSFLQRAYDQLIHDASLSGAHIVIGIDRAGLIGEDGETHQGLFDVGMLTTVPGITIFSPSCYDELKAALHKAVDDYSGIVCIRYPRGNDCTSFDKKSDKADWCYYSQSDSESENLLISYGRIFDDLYKASGILKSMNISCDILKLTKIYPLDDEAVAKACRYKNIIFFEEGMKNGGIAEHFLMRLAENGFHNNYHTKSVNGFVKQATVKKQLSYECFDCSSMAQFAADLLNNDKEIKKDET